MKFRCDIVGGCLLAILLCGGTSSAQRSDRGGRGGRGDFTPDFKRFDRNNNGTLEADEIPEFLRRGVSRYAEKAGLDEKQPLSVEKLNAAATADRQTREGSSEGSTAPPASGSPATPGATPMPGTATPPAAVAPPAESSKSKSNAPLVPGFGEKDPLAKASGFDVPLSVGGDKPIEAVYDPRVVERVQKSLRDNDRNGDGILDAEEIAKSSWSNPPAADSDTNKDGKLSKHELAERYKLRYGWTNPPGAAVAGAAKDPKADAAKVNPDTAKIRGYAEALLKQYDLNKNGLLEQDEWKAMKPEYHAADQNGDKVLTLDELFVKLNTPAASPSETAKSDGDRPKSDGRGSYSGGSSPGPNSKTIAAAKKAGRFLTATERLPKGLPDWFIRNDADGDGQVGMAEYSASWSESTAAEFAKYDLNSDGFITPLECLAVLKKSVLTSSSK